MLRFAFLSLFTFLTITGGKAFVCTIPSYQTQVIITFCDCIVFSILLSKFLLTRAIYSKSQLLSLKTQSAGWVTFRFRTLLQTGVDWRHGSSGGWSGAEDHTGLGVWVPELQEWLRLSESQLVHVHGGECRKQARGKDWAGRNCMSKATMNV